MVVQIERERKYKDGDEKEQRGVRCLGEGAERWEDDQRRETIEMREGANRDNGENKRLEGWERTAREIKGKKNN